MKIAEVAKGRSILNKSNGRNGQVFLLHTIHQYLYDFLAQVLIK